MKGKKRSTYDPSSNTHTPTTLTLNDKMKAALMTKYQFLDTQVEGLLKLVN